MINLENGGWVYWDYQMGSFSGQKQSGAPIVGGGMLWPSAWARTAGATISAEDEAALIEERDTASSDFGTWPLGGHPCVIRKEAFVDRLTQSEQLAILAAQGTPAIALILYRFGIGSSVDIRSQLIQSAVAALETAGLIGAGRADQLLGK